MIEVKGVIEKKLYQLNPANAIIHLHKNISESKARLEQLDPTSIEDLVGTNQYYQQIDESVERISQAMLEQVKSTKIRAHQLGALLSTLNPENVLSRGYSILSTKNGKVLTSYAEFDTIEHKDELSIKFSDGVGKVTKSN
jgi:exonuclease VII large subunit